MLNINTFDARAGGNVLYKALAHPLAAEAMGRLFTRLAGTGPVALYDPDDIAEALVSLYPDIPGLSGIYAHDVLTVGGTRAGRTVRALTELPVARTSLVLIAAFDASRIAARIRAMLPSGTTVLTLDEARLPATMLTNPARYMDRMNFATNFAFFRDADGMSTRLVSANYWAGYGAGPVRLWLRLYDAAGAALATWEQPLAAAAGFAIDSADIRAGFGLPAFCGQLCLHAIGAAGHDVVKYALDTYASDNGASLSCTHDANAWPSDRYAGLPAPRPDERVILWVQNSHATPIPAGAVTLDRMGQETPVTFNSPVPGFATVGLDVADLMPDLRWPAQIEVRTGRHVVRPRYEVTRDNRIRIAHVNVERADLKPDPLIPTLAADLGRGYLLPFPVLSPGRFRSIVQPTAMAWTQANLPLRLDLFDTEGRKTDERFLGRLARNHDLAIDIAELPGATEGHGELVYDFRDGGEADGWLHALFRYEHRVSGHVAESSFGAHIFNTAMTYKDEPQSYSGKPPGLTTRLFLRLGSGRRRSFAVLIYPASAAWLARSATALLLHDGQGRVIDTQSLTIACSGSAIIRPEEIFSATSLIEAGPNGYVLIRDETCRLFGYHGLTDDAGGFSLDHMFGF